MIAPDGLVVIAVRMRREGAGVFDPSRYGYTDAQVSEVISTLDAVGFRDATSQSREIGRETITAITARR